MRVVLIARVSTEEQATKGWSVADQLRELREHAERNGDEIVAELADEGYSGADPNRPALREALALAEAGAVDVIRTTKRDRLFRSRLYRLLFEEDVAEYGVGVESLNDIGHRLGDGLLDDWAEFEREQITQRTMAGKRQKARSGLILAGNRPRYGFSYSDDRSSLLVNEAEMAVVRRAVQMVADGAPLNSVRLAFDREGIPTPNRVKRWSVQAIKNFVVDDVYRPHSVDELAAVLSPEVLAGVDGPRGLWYFGRREFRKNRKTGRETYRFRDPGEWIAVPVPDSGIPRESVDIARRNIASNRKFSSAGHRVWELSGGMAVCAHCGYALTTQTTKMRNGKTYHYYTCRTYYERGRDVCAGKLNRRAEEVEAFVWRRVSGALKHPERLGKGIDKHIRAMRPERSEKELGRAVKARDDLAAKRARFQHLYAEGGISVADLRARTSELETQERELTARIAELRTASERVKDMERGRDEILAHYSALALEDLDSLEPDERAGLYRRLGLKVRIPRKGDPELEAMVDLGDPARPVGLSSLNLVLNVFKPYEIFSPPAAPLSVTLPAPFAAPHT